MKIRDWVLSNFMIIKKDDIEYVEVVETRITATFGPHTVEFVRVDCVGEKCKCGSITNWRRLYGMYDLNSVGSCHSWYCYDCGIMFWKAKKCNK